MRACVCVCVCVYVCVCVFVLSRMHAVVYGRCAWCSFVMAYNCSDVLTFRSRLGNVAPGYITTDGGSYVRYPGSLFSAPQGATRTPERNQIRLKFKTPSQDGIILSICDNSVGAMFSSLWCTLESMCSGVK